MRQEAAEGTTHSKTAARPPSGSRVRSPLVPCGEEVGRGLGPRAGPFGTALARRLGPRKDVPVEGETAECSQSHAPEGKHPLIVAISYSI